MTIREYRYYDAERKALDWEHLIEDLSQASEDVYKRQKQDWASVMHRISL